jgi:hypothetical protein
MKQITEVLVLHIEAQTSALTHHTHTHTHTHTIGLTHEDVLTCLRKCTYVLHACTHPQLQLCTDKHLHAHTLVFYTPVGGSAIPVGFPTARQPRGCCDLSVIFTLFFLL